MEPTKPTDTNAWEPPRTDSGADITDLWTRLSQDVPGRDEPTNARRVGRWARYHFGPQFVIGTFLVGMLAGTVLGVIGTFLWDRDGDREGVQSATVVHGPDVELRNDAVAMPPPAVSDVALLRDALDEWIEATRRGDIPAQMRFYPERVPVYYTWRDVPREAVRAEKIKVFGKAIVLDIVTDLPEVELAQDGVTATTRFRKQYAIEDPAVRRRGEVVQELRWIRTTAGWLILGERDARVLRSS